MGPLYGFSEYTCDDAFEMHLMFKPLGTDTLWVPLRKLFWNWYGDAVLCFPPDQYFLNGGDRTVGPNDMDSTTYPEWNSNIVVGLQTYVPE